MKDYFKYRFSSEFDFNLDEGDFVTVVGNNNDLIIHTLLHGNSKCNIFVGEVEHNEKNMDEIRKRIGFVLYKHLNIFVAETVRDEIVFGLESLAMSKDDMTQRVLSESRLFKLDNLLERDPNSLGSSDKVKMKILSSVIMNPNVLVIDNILCELIFIIKYLVAIIYCIFKYICIFLSIIHCCFIKCINIISFCINVKSSCIFLANNIIIVVFSFYIINLNFSSSSF